MRTAIGQGDNLRRLSACGPWNPGPQAFDSGFTTIGGYTYPTTVSAILQAFGTEFNPPDGVGGHQVPGWSLGPRRCLVLLRKNSFLDNAGRDCAADDECSRAPGYVGLTIPSNCSGDYNQASFLIDYTVNKHFDVYAGVTSPSITVPQRTAWHIPASRRTTPGRSPRASASSGKPRAA